MIIKGFEHKMKANLKKKFLVDIYFFSMNYKD